MRIVLVTTPTRTRKVNYMIPTGIIALAAHLEQCGHEVRVVDAALLREPYGEIARRVAEFDPHMVGVGGIITAYAYIIGLTAELRRTIPGVPIILGGPVVINNVNNCFTHMAVDFIVHGYGEIALEKLLRHHAGDLPVELIPGVSYRRGDEIVTNPGREFFKHLDDVPLPAYHLVDMDHYSRAQAATRKTPYIVNGVEIPDPRTLPIYATRGCTDRCSFCVHEQEFVGLKVSSYPKVMEHLEFLNREYGINIFSMGGEMFITKLSLATQFNELMKSRLPDCYWHASTRAEYVTPELVAELKTGNCLSLVWGYETGSQEMLNLINKRMARETNNLAWVRVKESELLGSMTIMVGNIGETYKTIQETIASINELSMDRASVFFATPYPGGRTWDWAVEKGIIGDTHEFLLSVSDRDASDYSINMTPFPDAVVRAWRDLVRFAIEKKARKNKRDHANVPTLRYGRAHFVKLVFRDIRMRFVLPLFCWAHARWYRFSRLFYKTEKDRRLAIETDAKGAIMPANLIVGTPQRHISPEKLQSLLQAPKQIEKLGGAR